MKCKKYFYKNHTCVYICTRSKANCNMKKFRLVSYTILFYPLLTPNFKNEYFTITRLDWTFLITLVLFLHQILVNFSHFHLLYTYTCKTIIVLARSFKIFLTFALVHHFMYGEISLV